MNNPLEIEASIDRAAQKYYQETHASPIPLLAKDSSARGLLFLLARLNVPACS
jgi:hypothetical protein